MARYGPSDNPGHAEDQPTRSADYRAQAPQPYPPPPVPGGTPWYRRRSVLTAWVILVATMIALVIWGIIQLASRGPELTPAPGPTSSTTPTTTSTTSTTSTTTTTPPPPAPTHQAPPNQEPPASEPPADEPHHRPHLPPLPSVITIPPIPKAPEVPTVITLPPHR